jgi:hypothetical protein
MSSRRPPRFDRSRHRPSPQSIPRKRQADDEEDKWVAAEDKFVLRQAKMKAVLRVRGGRAKPIDWLAVVLRVIDKSDTGVEDDEEEGQLDVVDPEGVFEGLGADELEELKLDIDTYLIRETNSSNRDFWSVSSLFLRVGQLLIETDNECYMPRPAIEAQRHRQGCPWCQFCHS